MTPTERRRLTSLGLILLVGTFALAGAFAVTPKMAEIHAEPQAYTVHADTNGTKNQTQNGTGNATLKALQDQINLLWAYLLGGNNFIGIGPALFQVETQVTYLAYGVGAAIVLMLLSNILMIRYFKKSLKEMREEKIGPEEPNLYAVLVPLMDKVLGADTADLVDKGAREQVMRLLRQKAREKRTRMPGVAGSTSED